MATGWPPLGLFLSSAEMSTVPTLVSVPALTVESYQGVNWPERQADVHLTHVPTILQSRTPLSYGAYTKQNL